MVELVIWLTSKRVETFCAAADACCRPLTVGAGAASSLPWSKVKSASSHPMVPFSNATTSLGIPARTSDSAPRMLRVRPAQFTTTVASCSSKSNTRCTSSPPGHERPVGILMRLNSRSVRESKITSRRPSVIHWLSCSAFTCGVP